MVIICFSLSFCIYELEFLYLEKLPLPNHPYHYVYIFYSVDYKIKLSLFMYCCSNGASLDLLEALNYISKTYSHGKNYKQSKAQPISP